ncbi:methyltransferase family protein [Pseudonocardia sediminis]|uniref:Methyltransferase family protein n=1 Tax=Pseudonocardia sediminis TaxID=1397368 RepID=A0A4Q7V0P1_PSEST|nr:class I SAM-dependent methyltransferase [Pseudonocardia sediminis]RZT86069.1 methyltransferase family protein [Pseudonocardia sediminis]
MTDDPLCAPAGLPQAWSAWKDGVDLERYDERWTAMEQAGENPHGEADLVSSFGPASVLDGGCGTGRVGIELARRGVAVVGVDPDPDMIAACRDKAPDLRWVQSGLQDLVLDERFDLVVLAGNVIPYAAPEHRTAVVAACARHLVPGGHLLAGFQLQDGWPGLDEYDAWCTDAGLTPVGRWSTWTRDPYVGGDYAVSLHARERM